MAAVDGSHCSNSTPFYSRVQGSMGREGLKLTYHQVHILIPFPICGVISNTCSLIKKKKKKLNRVALFALSPDTAKVETCE